MLVCEKARAVRRGEMRVARVSVRRDDIVMRLLRDDILGSIGCVVGVRRGRSAVCWV